VVLRGDEAWISVAVSVVTATLASRFMRGVWVPVTTIVCSWSGSCRRVKFWVACPGPETVTLVLSGRKPRRRACNVCVPDGTRVRVYSPLARV
jgi:hypothetical protein